MTAFVPVVADSSSVPREAPLKKPVGGRSLIRTNFEHKPVPPPYLFLHISNNQTHIRKRV